MIYRRLRDLNIVNDGCYSIRNSLSTGRKNGVILTSKIESLVELKIDPKCRVIV